MELTVVTALSMYYPLLEEVTLCLLAPSTMIMHQYCCVAGFVYPIDVDDAAAWFLLLQRDRDRGVCLDIDEETSSTTATTTTTNTTSC